MNGNRGSIWLVLSSHFGNFPIEKWARVCVCNGQAVSLLLVTLLLLLVPSARCTIFELPVNRPVAQEFGVLVGHFVSLTLRHGRAIGAQIASPLP